MGRSVRTSFVILDAQSVKNTATPQNKGYDGGKKVLSPVKLTLIKTKTQFFLSDQMVLYPVKVTLKKIKN
ncbi:hypothetical protein GRE01_03845 [Limosilactobacillus fermentum]|nr:hypothetical protein GRE01_03845 [Limosilactobacillus fermentum]